MNGEEILNQLQKSLDIFASTDNNICMADPKYKINVFRLFEQAYAGEYFSGNVRPLLTGEAISGALRARWLQRFSDDERDNAERAMEDVLFRWDEWRFAWDQRRD